MKFIKLLLVVVSLLILNSCRNCQSWGDNNLGGEFTLLEGDKVNDRAVIYCMGRKKPNECCTGGIPIIPSREDKITDYVESVQYDDRWVIVKGINIDKTRSYWILDKDFDTSWEYDDGGVFYNRIQNHIFGPFDESTFSKELEKKGIKINF